MHFWTRDNAFLTTENYSIWLVIVFWSPVAVDLNAVCSEPLSICALQVSMASNSRGLQYTPFFHHKCLPQQLVPCTAKVHVKMQSEIDEQVCACFADSNKDLLLRLSSPNNEIFLPHLQLCPCTSSLTSVFGRLHGGK